MTPCALAAAGTAWRVRSSEGLDAVAFLGPLSGTEMYRAIYAEDLAVFAPRLDASVGAEIAALSQSTIAAGMGLLSPSLAYVLSGAADNSSIEAVIDNLEARSSRLMTPLRATPYWSEAAWSWFDAAAPRLVSILAAMRDAGFGAFRAERTPQIEGQMRDLQQALHGYDVIGWQERLTGRRFAPVIEVVLLQFVAPHGIKVQGQQFLQSVDYGVEATVRNAAHELLHPPLDMAGPAAKAALTVLERDALIGRIVAEHNPMWGYHNLPALLEEDIIQALDQLISEGLGVANKPWARWNAADDGMHVLAAGLYGLLTADRWAETAGSIETWLAGAAQDGRLESSSLHAAAARVLQKSPDRLWPV